MFPAHVALVVLMSLLVIFSGVAKLRHDAHVVRIIRDVVRVPMKWFPWLAACEFAGAAGLLLGLAWAPPGIAAAVGLILYFIGAIVAHLRVGDIFIRLTQRARSRSEARSTAPEPHPRSSCRW
jgi:hypothetical protein